MMRIFKAITFVCCFLSFCQLYGQNQQKADSLLLVLEKFPEKDSSRAFILRHLARYAPKPEEAKKYAYELLEIGHLIENDRFIFDGNYYLGSAESYLGNPTEAVTYFFKALQSAHNLSITDESDVLTAIADVHSSSGDDIKALEYYNQAISLWPDNYTFSEREQRALATSYGNAGDTYFILEKYDSAILYNQIAAELFEEISYSTGLAYVLGNLGLAYAGNGNIDLGKEYMSKAIERFLQTEDYYPISVYYTYMADIYVDKGQFSIGLDYARRSLELAEQYNLKAQIRDAHFKLYELYEQVEKYKKSLFHHKQYLSFKDSIINAQAIRKMADLRTEFEVGQKQAEVDLLTAEKRTQRIITIAIGAFAFILVVLAAIIYKYYRSKAKINKILADQKAELERLNSTKDKFFSIISHDLRSPVAGFHGISQMIKMMVQTKQTDQLLEMTEHIDESVDQLSKLLDNLLNWAMQQQGHIPNVPEKLNLKEMSDDLVNTLSNMAQGKSIELVADVPENLELWSDKNTTMTILRNLVNNALKFTPEGGEVGIRATEESGLAKIEVFDTGVGMPKDKLKKLFQLQDKKSTYGTSGEKGLGLGLQLVHEFMEMNNGKIEVDSEEGKGTTFTLWLPLFESVGEAVEK